MSRATLHVDAGNDHLHVDAGNDSGEASARLLVFYLTEPGQPVTVLEN